MRRGSRPSHACACDVTEHDDHALKTRAVREHLLAALPVWIEADLAAAAD